jgi:peptidoglycan hydrolase-like protein with peptidoglycan-binding domain
MSPQQAGITLGSFLLVASGVATNALFMQAQPSMASRAVLERPLPRSTTADRMRNTGDVAQQVTRVAARKSTEDRTTQRAGRLDPASATLDGLPAVADTADEDTETIRALQRELRQRGYGPLVSDGIMRPVTRAAIMAYEHDQGLPLSGEASEMLLGRVLLGASASMEPASSAARKVATQRAAQVVRTVQEMLAKLGYQPGQTDGRLSEGTVRAMREFDLGKGIASKGRISADLFIRLTEAAQSGQPATKSASAR